MAYHNISSLNGRNGIDVGTGYSLDDWNSEDSVDKTQEKEIPVQLKNEGPNIVSFIYNRQLYGRFTKSYRGKTERIFKKAPPQCIIPFSSLVETEEKSYHIFMGFTLCGKYFVSFFERITPEIEPYPFLMTYEYYLYLWKFRPGKELKYANKYRIFKHCNGSDDILDLDSVKFMQYPHDPNRIVCFGQVHSCTSMAHLTILTLPSNYCKHCKTALNPVNLNEGYCTKHGYALHYVFSMLNPVPQPESHFIMAYPDHFVINTGHYIHIINISTVDQQQNTFILNSLVKEEEKFSVASINDALSEASETISDNFETNSVVDAILEDFGDYELDSGDCNKPFHELNISCEPVNVTGKSYHNTLVQNTYSLVDARVKRLQHNKDFLFSIPQTSKTSSTGQQKNSLEKPKVDINMAEKAYEFIEENEKCEKLSLFRKKRLAEKKYEFSEDNSENIVPFNSLRRERRFFHRSRYFNSTVRSPSESLFLSPRSPVGIRSPMQSPSAHRHGQCSPVSATNKNERFRNSPHHSRSPISPKELMKKFHVYSPSPADGFDILDDSRLILKLQVGGQFNESYFNNRQTGLLIVDPLREKPTWIKKLVRRYSNGDFETSSLLSGQSRDDFNIPIEIPLIVESLEENLDSVPDLRTDQMTQMQLIVTQRTFDCEQFLQRKAQQLCVESHLQFLHCKDYEVVILYICPLDGHIICKSVIEIGALSLNSSKSRPQTYRTELLFSWNIATDNFQSFDSPNGGLILKGCMKGTPDIRLPKVYTRKLLVMDYDSMKTKTILRDYNNYYEVRFDQKNSNFLNRRYIDYEFNDPYSSS